MLRFAYADSGSACKLAWEECSNGPHDRRVQFRSVDELAFHIYGEETKAKWVGDRDGSRRDEHDGGRG